MFFVLNYLQAFPRGSPLVSDVSRAILTVTEGEKYMRISEKWLGKEGTDCSLRSGTAITSDSYSLTLESFQGLFLIAGLSSSIALIIYLFIFFRDNRQILASDGSILQKLTTMAKIFNVEKKKNNSSGSHTQTSTELADLHQPESIFTSDDNEGFSTPTIEPATPTHDVITISDTK